MKRALILTALLALSPFVLFAAPVSGGCPTCVDEPPGEGGDGVGPYAPQLTDHGGVVMPYAKVVFIFWGPVPAAYASELQAYRDAPMANHMDMLAQYNAPQTSLIGSQADVFDTVGPSSYEVTDSLATQEIKKVFAGRFLANTIYVLVLPNYYFSSNTLMGSRQTSCDPSQGFNSYPNYCAYHHSFSDSATATTVKYAVIPYSSCTACRKIAATCCATANDVQSAEVVTLHEVRSAMTNPERTRGWYDVNVKEADDKCDTLVFYETQLPMCPPGSTCPAYHQWWFQDEWSNAAKGCVQ